MNITFAQEWSAMDTPEKVIFVFSCIAVVIACYGIVWASNEIKKEQYREK